MRAKRKKNRRPHAGPVARGKKKAKSGGPPPRVGKVENIFQTGEVPLKVGWADIAGNPFSLKCHPELELHYIRKGRGIYQISGCNYEFVGPACLVVLPWKVHSFVSSESCEHCRVMVAPEYTRATRLFAGCPKNFSPCFRAPARDMPYLELALNRIIEEEKRRLFGWQEMMKEQTELLFLLVRRLSRQPCLRLRCHPLISRLSVYIGEHFRGPLPLEALSKKFGLSARHLNRIFKQYYGIGPKRYVIQRRVAEAGKILQQRPGLKIEAVSESVGFRGRAVFERAFKAMTRLSPSVYRGLPQSAFANPAGIAPAAANTTQGGPGRPEH
jgi:AraC-like DNA-binding protein